ncbi:outer membrane protein [Legionella dresdenensis]|uniref:Outer membrane protein n=1 Tax=Legionella dresdenensis TaxID=450200 RepID=A0ABV8CHH9_9GAMM
MKLISKAIILLGVSSYCFAGTANIAPAGNNLANSANWFLNLQGGVYKAKMGESVTTVNNGSDLPSPLDRDIYTANNPNTAALLAVQAGLRWQLSHAVLSAFSLGIQYQHFFTSHINGQVMQYSLPEFTNYNYEWQTASNLALVNAKFNFMEYQRFSPYINGGIGIKYNTNSKYTEFALPEVTPRISPAYGNNSSTRFAWIVGAGLDYRFNQQFIINAGYQYSGLGKSSSAAGASSWATQHLNYGDYHANAFLLGLTYLFDTGRAVSYQK